MVLPYSVFGWTSNKLPDINNLSISRVSSAFELVNALCVPYCVPWKLIGLSIELKFGSLKNIPSSTSSSNGTNLTLSI